MAINEMDARLISQGAETTAIGSNALVSVAEGAGQPQKNIQLGNFADSMAKAVPQKTKDQVSITGLYAKTTDGKMVELTSESVASVVAGQMSSADYNKIVDHGISISDANQCTDNGAYYLGIATNAPSNYVILDVVNVGGRIIQKAFKIDDSTKRWTRVKESSTASFKEWSSF